LNRQEIFSSVLVLSVVCGGVLVTAALMVTDELLTQQYNLFQQFTGLVDGRVTCYSVPFLGCWRPSLVWIGAFTVILVVVIGFAFAILYKDGQVKRLKAQLEALQK
jgi:hypothetical protein